jgi:hypothetical protein
MMRVTVEAISPGAPARISHPIIRALQATPAEQATPGEAIAAEAAMLAVVVEAVGAVEAISNLLSSPGLLAGQTVAGDILDSFQSV